MNILATKDVCKKLGVSRAKLWRMTKEGRFPQPITVDGRRKGYVDEEVEGFIEGRIAARDAEARP